MITKCNIGVILGSTKPPQMSTVSMVVTFHTVRFGERWRSLSCTVTAMRWFLNPISIISGISLMLIEKGTSFCIPGLG